MTGFLSRMARMFAHADPTPPPDIPVPPNVELVTITAAALQYERLRAARLAEGPLDTANADRALAEVYTPLTLRRMLRSVGK